MNTVIKQYTFTVLYAIISAYCLISCNKSEERNLGDGNAVLVEIAAATSTYEAEPEKSNRAAHPQYKGNDRENTIRQSTIELDNGFLLVSQLIPDQNDVIAPSLKDAAQAATETNDLLPGIRYRLAVYNNLGNFVTERTYIRGQEASTAALLLDGGSTYTFIAYSLNSTADNLPAISPATGRTLTNSQTTMNGTQDYMLWRGNLSVSGNQLNRLNIIFRHRFSQITTIIDATQTGYNVVAVTSTFQNTGTTVTSNISTGAWNYPSSTPASVVFPNTGAQSTSSTPTIICLGDGLSMNYNIASIQIGNLVQTNLTPFTGLTISPGFKYNLILNIVPADSYVTVNGIEAARINGKVWMRRNLGVSNTLDPDVTTGSNINLTGNYYQWGRATIVANGNTQNGTISPWNTTNPARNSWNGNTEASPTKTTADPCPSGFRVPTVLEINALYAATNTESVGNWGNSVSNFSAYKVLTSRRNANVKLTFPVAGNRRWDNGATNDRGNMAFYWSSNSTSSSQANHVSMSVSDSGNGVGNSVMNWAFPIRCIQQ